MNDGIFIPKRSKLCPNHIVCRDWTLKNDFWNHKYTAAKIDEMFDLARKKRKKHDEPKNAVSELTKNDIGLDENQFNALIALIPSLSRAVGSDKKARQCLQLYLMRMRKDMTFEDLGKRFQMTPRTASKLIKKARSSLTCDLVGKYFGFKNITRADLERHTSQQSRILYCNGNEKSVISIWDGTYIYCQQSGNYRFQKETYSVQKKRNLVKPMVCVASDGFIIDIFCPFKASENDASILKQILAEHKEVRKAFQLLDVFVVDRGFRDSETTLEEYGYVVKMPCFADGTGWQLTNKQANDSRIVTKLRWIVEARNGHLKTIWPIFAREWTTRELVNLKADIQIAAAIINMFFKLLSADQDEGETIVQSMMEKAHQGRPTFHKIIQGQAFQKQIKNFIEINVNSFDFPVIAKKDLKFISLGNYQIKQAARYTIQHTKSFTESFECFECPQNILRKHFKVVIDEKNILIPALVLARLASRFKNKKNYNTFVLVDNAKSGVDAICAHYCTCVNGLRTVGCCAHIMCVIRFLCYARHTGDKKCIAPYLESYFDSPDDS